MSSLPTETDYIDAVNQAMDKAYAPYSNYPVGALIVTCLSLIHISEPTRR